MCNNRYVYTALIVSQRPDHAWPKLSAPAFQGCSDSLLAEMSWQICVPIRFELTQLYSKLIIQIFTYRSVSMRAPDPLLDVFLHGRDLRHIHLRAIYIPLYMIYSDSYGTTAPCKHCRPCLGCTAPLRIHRPQLERLQLASLRRHRRRHAAHEAFGDITCSEAMERSC